MVFKKGEKKESKEAKRVKRSLSEGKKSIDLREKKNNQREGEWNKKVSVFVLLGA